MKAIRTDRAPAAVGTYSQGRLVGDRVVTAGQIGLDPESGQLEDDDFTSEARRTLENVLAVVEDGGGDASSVIQTTVYLTDLDYYDQVNSLYESYFEEPYPARSLVEVRSLPRGARIEIQAEAQRN